MSTPAEQGLDPKLVKQLYHHATELSTLYSILVIKNDHLVAEHYFHQGNVDQQALLQSVSKSYFSALFGIALERGCVSNLDQKMMEFFPEYADQIKDPRKNQITLRQLLQMRSGYPWEETDPDTWEALVEGDLLPLLVSFPLTADPGAEFQYSNLTSHLLGTIVSRSCDADLEAFAREHLFSQIGGDPGEMWRDDFGYVYSLMQFTARDAGRFGQLFLDSGAHQGKQVIPREWVEASLRRYSQDINVTGGFPANWGLAMDDAGYGYQWWSATAGEHSFDLAWGHGGQLIVLVHELDMVIVTTADPFFKQHDAESWKHELAIVNTVSEFIETLP